MSSDDPRPRQPKKNAARWEWTNYAQQLESWEERESLRKALGGFGNGEAGGSDQSTNPVHGANAEGDPVTASFGVNGDTYLADGHVESGDEFWGSRGSKGHDHYGTGDGRNNNGTQRGKYTGSGS
ncbi:hypothetical protein OG407_23995 [Streptomyces sp. NBC_01515]|uniref:hypothetical protein n=1 Tax=Streptomyces sp. NBC_01515 TaxID=2903890 RepID=UPI00386E4E1F